MTVQVGNVDAVLVVQPHPKDCPLCVGDLEVKAAPMRWHNGSLRPAWPVARLERCPWPFGADALLSALGVSGSAPGGPGDVA